MSEKWAVDIVATMQKKSQNQQGEQQDRIMIGKVLSANPLKISVSGQSIEKHLHISSALLLLADDDTDKIDEAFKDSPSSGKWFDFLKEYHQKSVIKKDDEVVLMQSGISFYIISKVVAV